MNEAWQRLGPGVLSIDLVNEEHQAAIYISDDETYRNKLTLKVKNVSTGKVTLKKSDTAHIEVFFPKGVLDEKNLPKPNQIKVSEWGGMGGKDLFNFDQIEDKPLIDMDKLNAQAKIDVSGMMDSIDATELEPSDTATRGIKSRSVTSESDLTKLVKESNELRKQALEELKGIRDNKQLTNNPVIQRGLAKFSGLFKKLSDLSSQVDTNIEELYDLQKRVEQGREFAKEEIFKYIQEELSTGVKTYLESIEGQDLFNNQVELSVKDIMANLEGLQLSDEVAKTLSKPKTAAGWNVEVKDKSEGVTIQITKTSVDEIVLESGDYLNIEIANVKPNPEGGTRNSSIELHYPSIDIEGSANEEAGTNRFSQSPISIINRRGQKYAALQLSIVKGQMILNDGETPNEVVLRMINLGKDSIYFKNAGLNITYEVQMEGEDESYALTEKDDIVTIALTNSKGEKLINTLNGANTFENTAKVGQNPMYEFKVAENQNFELTAADYWMITISDLKTGLDAGFANIEFSYNNVPEYWDGAMAATVQRTPIVYAESKVGIGVLDPTNKVHIKDNGSLLKLEGTDESFVEFATNEDESQASIGFSNENDDFSINNKVGDINLAPKKEVTINGDVPFHFKRFEVTGQITRTKYSARDWNAGIVGLGTDVVDFADGQGADIFRMEIGDDGNWCIRIFRDFSSTDGQNGSIDVMFVSKKISTRFDWR